MRSLLDTHFVLWIAGGSRRLRRYRWIDRYQPWGVSPASFLEIAILSDGGRIDAEPGFIDRVTSDERFVVDEASMMAIIRHAAAQAWTGDPFDRFLVGHSLARRVPLCTIDRHIIRNHPLVPDEVAD